MIINIFNYETLKELARTMLSIIASANVLYERTEKLGEKMLKNDGIKRARKTDAVGVKVIIIKNFIKMSLVINRIH